MDNNKELTVFEKLEETRDEMIQAKANANKVISSQKDLIGLVKEHGKSFSWSKTFLEGLEKEQLNLKNQIDFLEIKIKSIDEIIALKNSDVAYKLINNLNIIFKIFR